MIDILNRCTKSDVMTMCNVSFRWLQQGSEVLYKNIELDERTAVRLFCKRVKYASQFSDRASTGGPLLTEHGMSPIAKDRQD